MANHRNPRQPHPRRQRFGLFGSLWLLCAFSLLAGCGGGGGPPVAQTGTVEIRVDWPGRGRYVPPYADSVKATLTDGAQQFQVTLNRSGNTGYQGAATVAPPTSVGSHTLKVDAHENTN